MSDLNTLLHYGTVKVRPYGSAPMPFMELSAMADVNSSREVEELTIADPRSPYNSELDGRSRPGAMRLTGNLLDLKPEVFAALLESAKVEAQSGTATDEQHIAEIGRTSVTERLVSTVTKVSSDDGATVYVADTDYIATVDGVVYLAGGQLETDINAATPGPDGVKRLPVKITYSYPMSYNVEAFTKGRQYWEVVVSTKNEAGSNQSRKVTFHRARLAIGGDLPLINRDDFGVVPIEITCSADPKRLLAIGGSDSAIMSITEQL